MSRVGFWGQKTMRRVAHAEKPLCADVVARDGRGVLDGGVNHVIRHHNTVLRPMGPWSPTVHRLLLHLRARGFTLSPGYRGVTSEGLEILDYMEGTVGGYPITPEAGTRDALRSAARALRDLHDASASFTRERSDKWMLAPRVPSEVICHGDFGPHNCVLQGTDVVGMIDFDAAHPGPRLWDVAYSVYRWAPMSATSDVADARTVFGQAQRVQIFCDEYGLSRESREQVVDLVVDRLRALVDFMRHQAANGVETYARHVERGDDVLYSADIEYILANRTAFEERLALS